MIIYAKHISLILILILINKRIKIKTLNTNKYNQ